MKDSRLQTLTPEVVKQGYRGLIRWRNAVRKALELAPKRYGARLFLEQAAPRIQRNPLSAVPSRRLPHFLILRNRYYSQNRALGDSTEKFMVEGTLDASHLATFETMFWETDFSLSPFTDVRLLRKCEESRPDAVILSSYNPEHPSHPSLEALRMVRERWKIPVASLCWDTCSSGFWKGVPRLLPAIDVFIVADNPCLFFAETAPEAAGRILPVWSPLDPFLYRNPGEPRDIAISFVGQVSSYRSSRMEYIQHLLESGLPVYTSLQDRQKQLTHEQYIATLQHSKISVNFSYSVESHQLKGRVFETMLCGAMLMESENPQIARYFEPMKHYVSFSSKEDLVDRLRYFVEHEDERREIAARGEERAQTHFNHVEFWKALMNRLKVVG